MKSPAVCSTAWQGYQQKRCSGSVYTWYNNMHHPGLSICQSLSAGWWYDCISKVSCQKGPYLPCVSMTGRALLAGYPRYVIYTDKLSAVINGNIDKTTQRGDAWCHYPTSSRHNLIHLFNLITKVQVLNFYMMLSHRNGYRITGPLCREWTAQQPVLHDQWDLLIQLIIFIINICGTWINSFGLIK